MGQLPPRRTRPQFPTGGRELSLPHTHGSSALVCYDYLLHPRIDFFFLAIQTSISLFCNVSVCESSCCGCCVLPFSARLLGDALSRVTILALPRLGGYR